MALKIDIIYFIMLKLNVVSKIDREEGLINGCKDFNC